MTNREIASTLIITENTVKVHLRNILDKLELRNRQQLAAFAASYI
jgi:DNA-binding NarL/FixJ family response regulator